MAADEPPDDKGQDLRSATALPLEEDGVPVYSHFHDFDPKDGAVPAQPFPALPAIAARARAYLEHRTTIEIGAAASFITYAADDELARRRGLAHRQKLADGSSADAAALDDLFFHFRWSYEYYDLQSFSDFPGGREHEFFAVLALLLVSRAVHSLSGQHDSGERVVIAANLALQAMESICFADYLVHAADFEAERASADAKFDRRVEIATKQRRSINARKAAIRRHDEHYRLRDEAITIWQQRQFKSIEQAAAHISREIPVGHRTIAKWISAYLRSPAARRT